MWLCKPAIKTVGITYPVSRVAEYKYPWYIATFCHSACTLVLQYYYNVALTESCSHCVYCIYSHNYMNYNIIMGIVYVHCTVMLWYNSILQRVVPQVNFLTQIKGILLT